MLFGFRMMTSCLRVALFVTLATGVSLEMTIEEDNVYLVKTSCGNLRGLKRSGPGGDVVQFLGIPYAKPPVGDRRFERPFPPDKWSGNKDAFQFSKVCVHLHTYGPISEMSEDCLYLNVYVPLSGLPDVSGNKLSVMVWIHGGGYKTGAGSFYDAYGLSTKGMIVVTINFRHNIFGFLSTEDDVIPGNFGMMDQIMALKWVQKNIATFGGDPSKVTIAGESTGSCSVSLLILSPLAKGLFTRAMMTSGSSLSTFAITHPTTRIKPRMAARIVAATIGCSEMQSVPLLQCLRTVDYESLLEASVQIEMSLAVNTNNFIWKPRVENTFGFLPDLPINLLVAGEFNQVDTVQGFTIDEAGIILRDFKYESMTQVDFKKAILGTLGLGFLGALKSFEFPDKDEFINMALNVYDVKNTSDPAFIRNQTIQAITNLGFVGSVMNEIGLLISRGDPKSVHYLFQLIYRPSFSTNPPWHRAIHGDDLGFMFGTEPLYSRPLSDGDKKISDRYMTSVSNFVITGNPNLPDSRSGLGNWRPYTTSSGSIMNIDTVSTLSEYVKPETTKLFLELVQKMDTVFVNGDWISV